MCTYLVDDTRIGPRHAEEMTSSPNPRAVIGSVGDSWIVRGFSKEVRDVEEEKIDWLRYL
jgi:hypothetical protein